MGLVVRILGPLEVVHNGTLVPIRAGRERALFVRLALEPGRVVSFDRLVECLWDAEAPTSADASVRVLISRIRKALSVAGCDGAIRTRSPGYLLLVDEDDASGFEQLSARGRAELAGGRPQAAAKTLAEALGLWRGDRLADTSSEVLRAEAVRLDEHRLMAAEARVEAELACGRQVDVLGELEALCRAHPLREGLWALHILALYRCNRQADALAAYQSLRRLLADELGIDPSPRLRRLEAAVLNQDPALAAPAPGASPGITVPLPAALGAPERVPLVGRAEELQAGRDMWSDVVAGGSAAVLVPGEPGIGKSRLLRELARSVGHQGAAVLYGRCDEDLAVPYRPFIECLSHLLHHLSDGALASVESYELAELARLIPGLTSRRPELTPPGNRQSDVEQYLLFASVGSLLAAAAREQPVMMMLDDLHWADKPTLLLLRHLGSMHLGRVAIVAAYRPGERSYGPLVEAVGAMQRDAHLTRISPDRLSRSQVTALVSASGVEEPDEVANAVAGLLHHATGGNPFYVVELLSHLRETHALDQLSKERSTGQVDLGAFGLPDSIRAVLRARLERLGAEAAAVLAAAAVIGQEFDLDVLARIADVPVETLLDVLEVAENAALVSDDLERSGCYRFAHALVQQTLYHDIGRTRRTRMHGRVAEAMEMAGGRQPGEIAFHLLAGMTPGTTTKAVQFARSAGERALVSSAPDEAVRWYSAALKALPPPRDDTDHARALVDLGDAQRQAGSPDYRSTLLAAARLAASNGANDLLVEAALASCRGSFSSLGQVDAEKMAVLESALAVTAAHSVARARLLAVMAGELSWDPDHVRRLALADEAVAVARRVGESETLLFAIIRPGPTRWVPETCEQRVRLLREAVVLAERTNDRAAHFEALHLLAPMLLERVSSDRLDDALDDAAEVADQIREPFRRWTSLYVRACLAIARGELERAEREAGEALRIGQESGQPDWQEWYDEQLFIIRWHQGRLAEALPRMREVASLLPNVPTRWAGLAHAEALVGSAERAREMLRQAADQRFEMFYGASWLGCMCQWADVAAELDSAEGADVLYEKLTPWSHLFATAGPLPIHGVSLALARLAALLGQTEAADRHFEHAMGVHEAARAPFGLAETALHRGRLLLTREPERAKACLTQASELAARYGFQGIAQRAGRMLPLA